MSCKVRKCTFRHVLSEDSNQQAHPCCLIRSLLSAWRNSASRAQWRFWSACISVQADLNLRWVHMFKGMLTDVAHEVKCGEKSILHKWIMKAQTILVWLGSSLPVRRISVSCRIYLYKNRLDRLCRFTGWSGLPLFTNSIRALFSWHTAFWVRSHWVGYIGKDEQFSLLPYYKLIIVKEKWGIRAFINSKGPGKFTNPCNMLPDKYLCSFV